jgi:glucose-6-phosphate isomerase
MNRAVDFAGDLQHSCSLSLGPLEGAADRLGATATRAARGLRQRDAGVWTSDLALQARIRDRLGWLDSPGRMAEQIGPIEDFAARAIGDGFSDVLLIGTGGASLASEVLCGVIGVSKGRPRFSVLDSTDPAAIRLHSAPPDRTLYLIASKSGTTIESTTLSAHFEAAVRARRGDRWSDHFAAITDEGTPLALRARAQGFREVFVNPPDIGGRYSALSLFGLVPAVLMGQDAAALLHWAQAMLAAMAAGLADGSRAAGVDLGLFIGAAATTGCDKLTLILPPRLETFGSWVEQLVAESTGKGGVGVVPIVGEGLGTPDEYDADRCFVHVRFAQDPDADDLTAAVDRIRAAGRPVAAITVRDAAAVGAEFVRWQVATAIAGAILGINPFDEPDVDRAKLATRRCLERFRSEGRVPAGDPDMLLDTGTTLTLSRTARSALGGSLARQFLTLIRRGDYVAILPYLGPDAALRRALDGFRRFVRGKSRAATVLCYGPRYLHSTGQLHKGGPDTGLFFLVTAAPEADIEIAGEPYTFGTLELAQALGDFASLDELGRRALHVHLPAPDRQALTQVLEVLAE